MKTTASKESPTPTISSKSFFSKKAEGGFFAQTKEADQPFFAPDISRQGGAVGGHNFANIPIFPPRSQPVIQTKLTINEPGDQYEQEADTMADRVMRMSEMPVGETVQTISSPISPVQRKCPACEGEENVQRKETEEEEHLQTKPLMRKAAGGGYTASPQLASQLNSSKGGGDPLPGQTLGFMNKAFGLDFDNVKIHTGNDAVQMSRALGAQAFTLGNDIYFNEGKYNPQSRDGRSLLAHELTHTIQQRTDPHSNQISLKRDPNADDKIQLSKFQVYKAALEAKREETVEGILERVDSQMPGIEESLAKKETSSDERKMLEQYREDRYATWQKWIKDIDDAISFIEYEELTYRWTLENRASKYDKIVWHSSQTLVGWIRESESSAIQEMESSPFYQMGVRHGTFFAKLRSQGKSLEDATLATIGLGILDITGLSNAVESISGHDLVSGRELSTQERILKGVVGLVSVASIVSMGGPRLSGWAKGLSGNLRVLQTSSIGGLPGIMLAVDGGAVIALTQAEVVTLVGAGVLNVSVMHMAAGTGKGGAPQSVKGLSGSYRGAPRGGGGNSKAKAYGEKVNKANGSNPPDQSVYVKGVEFDGYNQGTKALLDAKMSKGTGSWYDVSGKSSFTVNVKIPEILKQARRQLAALPGSGASGIEWHFSDAGTVTQIRALFKNNGINIIVKHTPL